MSYFMFLIWCKHYQPLLTQLQLVPTCDSFIICFVVIGQNTKFLENSFFRCPNYTQKNRLDEPATTR